MKTSLAHLPEDKQHQLRWSVDIIQESVNPDMLVLFGSYARGDWVEELVSHHASSAGEPCVSAD